MIQKHFRFVLYRNVIPLKMGNSIYNDLQKSRSYSMRNNQSTYFSLKRVSKYNLKYIIWSVFFTSFFPTLFKLICEKLLLIDSTFKLQFLECWPRKSYICEKHVMLLYGIYFNLNFCPQSPFGCHYHLYVYEGALSPVQWIRFSPPLNGLIFLKSKSLIS